jgi:hypothetical protein
MEPVTGVGSELVALPEKETSPSDVLWEAIDDWKDLTMLSAIALQIVQMTTKFFQTFLTQLFTLGSLTMGAYYVNACKYMQTFKESALKLEATNAALNEKVARLETAAGTLVSTIAKFDTDTADYFMTLAEHDSGLQDSVDRINHAVAAFSRVLEDDNLSFLWKETLEAVREFQQAKAEYDQIRAAIQAERETLAQLHIALREDESNLADLYRQYSNKLLDILSRTSQPPQGQ